MLHILCQNVVLNYMSRFKYPMQSHLHHPLPPHSKIQTNCDYHQSLSHRNPCYDRTSASLLWPHNHIKVIWFLLSCYPESARSARHHDFDEVRIHPYDQPLHQKVFNHFINIRDGSVIKYGGVPGIKYVIVVWFVPSCYP